MTNPAEKIRQVVEETQQMLDVVSERPLWDQGVPTIWVTLDKAQEEVDRMAVGLLDAIIEEIEERKKYIDGDHPSSTVYEHSDNRAIAHMELHIIRRALKQARTSLTNTHG